MKKVSFFDRKILNIFLQYVSAITTISSFLLIFVTIPEAYKMMAAIFSVVFYCGVYAAIWVWANRIKKIDLKIKGSDVTIKEGDLFTEAGFKVIPFNQYFDTVVDDNLIAKNSLNGIFITQYANADVSKLDEHIKSYRFVPEELEKTNENRRVGKQQQYKIGTICTFDDYMLTAFSKFNDQDMAVITMSEYLSFLICFWDNVNRLYAQKNVSVPIFGSGITRIKEHKNIEDEELLKIMLWTFRISEMKFKYPAKLTLVIHKSKIDQINLFDVKSFEK